MTVEGVIALVLFLLSAVLGIRYTLRAKCLGCCAHCPRSGACAAERANTAGKQEA